MAEYHDREAFIPFSRQDVIQLCLEEGQLSTDAQKTFGEFCEILAAYYHYEFHQILEKLKTNFAHLDPDADTRALKTPTETECKRREEDLINSFETVLRQANYIPLDEKGLEQAFEGDSLITLDMDIDFNDFERMLFFWRGSREESVEVKKMLLKKTITMEVLERVVLLIKFKDEVYFKAKFPKLKPEQLDFSPGKTYIYLYKDIPKMDLEVLFPNVEIHMTWKDKLMLIVPALGASIPVMIKALPQILLIAGVVLFFTLGPSAALNWGIEKSHVQNILPVLVALLSLGMVLGAFAVKQYLNYKNKKLKFLKDVTDTLFFKNLVCNAGVFHSLIDAAEEEECKEIILAYYQLLVHSEGLSCEELDNNIENWLEEQHQTIVDFDVQKALNKMLKLEGKIEKEGQLENAVLVKEIEPNKYQALPLDDSRVLVDHVWDNLFQYNNH